MTARWNHALSGKRRLPVLHDVERRRLAHRYCEKEACAVVRHAPLRDRARHREQSFRHARLESASRVDLDAHHGTIGGEVEQLPPIAAPRPSRADGRVPLSNSGEAAQMNLSRNCPVVYVWMR